MLAEADATGALDLLRTLVAFVVEHDLQTWILVLGVVLVLMGAIAFFRKAYFVFPAHSSSGSFQVSGSALPKCSTG
jgi:hypothetical protein